MKHFAIFDKNVAAKMYVYNQEKQMTKHTKHKRFLQKLVTSDEKLIYQYENSKNILIIF